MWVLGQREQQKIILSMNQSPTTSQPKNLVVIGCTGAGKSSFCNALLGKEVFKVSDGYGRQTLKTQNHFSPQLNLNLIDTFGFGDTTTTQQQSEMSSIFRNLKPSELIHSFILIAPCNPRPSTLISDLNNFLNRFGTSAFRTLIIAFLDLDNKNIPKGKFDDQISNMAELKQRFEQAGVKLTGDRYLQWNSDHPRAEQNRELLEKIQKVESYDTFKFLEAANQRRVRQEKEIEAKINQEVERVKKQHASSLVEQEQLIAKMKEKQETEKGQLAERLEMQNKALIEGLMERVKMSQTEKEEMAQMVLEMKKEHSEALARIAKTVGHDQQMYAKKMMEFQKIQQQNQLLMINGVKEMIQQKEMQARQSQLQSQPMPMARSPGNSPQTYPNPYPPQQTYPRSFQPSYPPGYPSSTHAPSSGPGFTTVHTVPQGYPVGVYPSTTTTQVVYTTNPPRNRKWYTRAIASIREFLS